MKNKQFCETSIKYYDRSTSIGENSYWDIVYNVIDPVDGTSTIECIRTESDNEVLQTIVAQVIPSLKSSISSQRHEILSECNNLRRVVAEQSKEIKKLKSKKWYQFWK